MRTRLRDFLGLTGVVLSLSFAGSAQAYQIKLVAPYARLKAEADSHSADLQRLSPQWALLLGTALAGDGELWCRVQLQNHRYGWIPARFVDPAPASNQPLNIAAFPAELIFEFAQRGLMYQSATDAGSRQQQRRWSYEMQLALLTTQWQGLRDRLNFLDVSRRAGVAINAAEYTSLKLQQQRVGQKFQAILNMWQHS